MRVRVKEGGRTYEVTVELTPEPHVTVDGKVLRVSQLESTQDRIQFELEGQKTVVVGEKLSTESGEAGTLTVNGEYYHPAVELTEASRHDRSRPAPVGKTASTPSAGSGEGSVIVPPMPGKVLEVLVKEGQDVRKGTPLLVLEAMKMRNEVSSPVDGVVAGPVVSAGSNVKAREVLLRIVPRKP